MNDEELHYPALATPAPGSCVEVAPGVHWVRMPLPFALDHVNLWLLEDGDGGLTVVDTGFAGDAVQRHWEEILARNPGRGVTRIVVTHCHPDHLGLAAWLRDRSGAELWMTQGEFLGGQAMWHQLPGYCVSDMVRQFHTHGLDGERCSALERRGNAYRRGVPEIPSSYRRFFDGQQLEIGGRGWRVIVGYGHSPEHASLYCEELGVLISGDMLLPRISTNVSVFAVTPSADPLTWFLDSLRCINELPQDTLVLPSHGFPFRGIPVRVAQLVEHHRERCAALLAAIDAPSSAGELLETLFPRALDTHQVMFAMGEAIAHLNHLAHKGALRQQEDRDGRIHYRRTD